MKTTDIGKKIVKIREARGLSQKELAEQIPVSPSTLSRWEKGIVIPPLQQLERVCVVLGVPLSRVFEDDKEKYDKIRVKLSRVRFISVALALLLLLILVVIFVPKYKVIKASEVFEGDYGQTVTVYVKPIFIFTEKESEAYGCKIAMRYAENTGLDIVEVVFVKKTNDIQNEKNIYESYIYFENALRQK